jgi:hypothetical protein
MAERPIQSSIREWADAAPLTTSAERHDAMRPWPHHHNQPTARAGRRPISRRAENDPHGSDI